MSVLMRLDLGTGDWSFDVNPEPISPDLQIGFHRDGGPASLEGLTFGLTVLANGALVTTRSYPVGGARYVWTDQAYLVDERVDLAADDEVMIVVWAVSNSSRYEATTTFVVPRPLQPFPSWSWQDGVWTAPMPEPEEGFWIWDEDAGEWVEAPGDD